MPSEHGVLNVIGLPLPLTGLAQICVDVNGHGLNSIGIVSSKLEVFALLTSDDTLICDTLAKDMQTTIMDTKTISNVTERYFFSNFPKLPFTKIMITTFMLFCEQKKYCREMSKNFNFHMKQLQKYILITQF